MLQDEILPWFEKKKTKRKEKRRRKKKKKKKNGSYHFELSTQNEKLVVHASAPRRTSVCDKLTKKKKNTLINIQSEHFPRGTKIGVSEPTKNILIDGPNNYQLDLPLHTTRVKDSTPLTGTCHPILQTIAAIRNAALVSKKPSLHHETSTVHEFCNYHPEFIL